MYYHNQTCRVVAYSTQSEQDQKRSEGPFQHTCSYIMSDGQIKNTSFCIEQCVFFDLLNNKQCYGKCYQNVFQFKELLLMIRHRFE